MHREPTASYATTVTPIPTAATPAQAAVIFGKHTDCCILESTLPDDTYARYSVYAVDPVEVVEIPFDPMADPLEALPVRLGLDRPCGSSGAPIPFAGGWFGYLGYEAGLAAERLWPSAAWPGYLPVVRLGLFDAVAVFDHARGQWFATAIDVSAIRSDATPMQERIEMIRGLLDAAEDAPSEVPPAPAAADPAPRFTPAEYLDCARRAKRYIEAGAEISKGSIKPSSRAIRSTWKLSPVLFSSLKGRNKILSLSRLPSAIRSNRSKNTRTSIARNQLSVGRNV